MTAPIDWGDEPEPPRRPAAPKPRAPKPVAPIDWARHYAAQREQQPARHTVDTITSDALDALYEMLDATQETELARQLATADKAFYSAHLRAARNGAALARAQRALASTILQARRWAARARAAEQRAEQAEAELSENLGVIRALRRQRDTAEATVVRVRTLTERLRTGCP